MWTLIFLGMGLACVTMLFFLISRFSRFSWIRRRGKKGRTALAALLVFGLSAACWAWSGAVNLVIILVHLGVIWLICDGLAALWRRIKRGRGGNPGEFVPILRFRRRRIKSGNGGNPAPKENGEKRYTAGAAALLITVIYLACGWYLANHVWEKDYTIETDKKVGSLRAVMFADSHLGTTFDGEGFAALVKRMQAANPDVVLIAGDYVDDDTSREDMIAGCAALGTLKTTYGVYFVFGNHDKGYYGDAYRGYSGDDLIEELRKNGVHVLQDETISLDGRFYIVGRQDRSETRQGRSRASMDELMRPLDPEMFCIVVDHQPQDYDAQEAAGADLVLSGHTHGGQFFPFNYMGEWTGINDKTYGLEKRGGTSFLVTSGISDWAVKFKTGCRSEFTVIDIRGK